MICILGMVYYAAAESTVSGSRAVINLACEFVLREYEDSKAYHSVGSVVRVTDFNLGTSCFESPFMSPGLIKQYRAVLDSCP